MVFKNKKKLNFCDDSVISSNKQTSFTNTLKDVPDLFLNLKLEVDVF
jgi:hypothetical protein